MLKSQSENVCGEKIFVILSSNGPIYEASVLSLLCWCVCSLATLYAKDLEQTLAETPRYTPCSLSAAICGTDWCGLRCLGQSSCVIQEAMHQATEAEGGCLMSKEMSESESRMGATSKDVRNRREQNWKDLGTMCPLLYLRENGGPGMPRNWPTFLLLIN